MSDTIACANCATEVPAAAAFCTGCGQPLAAAPPASDATPPPPPPVDATQVETPGLNDATQVQPAPPAPAPPAPAAPTPAPPAGFAAPPTGFAPPPAEAPASPFAPPAADPAAPPASVPWGPASSTPVPPGPPTTAPWNPPASPPPPSYQQPAAPQAAATFSPSAAPLGGGTTWGAPGTAAAPAWGTQPAEATPVTPAKRGSVLGGLVALLGSVLAIVGVFSGWVKLDTTGTVTAWSLTEGEGLLKSNDPYVILGLGALGVVVALLLFTGVARTVVRLVAFLTGIGIVATAALNWSAIASFVTDNLPSSFEATTAIGFYLAIAGGVLLALSSIIPAKK